MSKKVALISEYIGMIFCTTGSFLMMLPSNYMILCFLLGSLSFAIMGYINKSWGLFASQAFCVLLNIYIIIKILLGTWR